ncbi:hypothetical protein GCM10023149_19670 [Mucilaginibacter gynuensis]|uniref:Organic solvent tolerance-like N-terminal domain-containing protein n=1 Tax=Mucilaginibacter gynuensis TaxID=1302236 RepID=A0ABP8GA73_9SPHI
MAQQKKSQVRLIKSDRSEGIKRNGKDVIKVYNGTFQQDYSILRSDSAYFYPQDNAFDAFSNVNISQGDTLNIFSDKLNYNGNTKIAILTDNVKMVDKDATLTTNYLTYNTAARIGTYTGGGKLVNKDNTLTSKNGWYFAQSRDAYFRYDVVLNTIDALIKTDTLRYNSGTRIAYFYGPTNIYGKAKDKDTLYTDKGLYNTVTEQAFFSKNNLYKQGTKSLKGDSLFYDRLVGFGRAVKHITFTDTEQKVTLKGDLGTYYKSQERAVVTENAYVIFITEEKDTTATDTTVKDVPLLKKDSTGKAITDAAKAAVPAVKDAAKAVKKPELKTTDKSKAIAKPTITIAPPKQKMKVDSVYMSADTLETQIMTYGKLKALKEKMRTANMGDTIAKKPQKPAPIVYKTSPKHLDPALQVGIRRDTGATNPLLFGKPKPVGIDTTKKGLKNIAKIDPKKARQDSINRANEQMKTDPVYAKTLVTLSDTARVRTIMAYHDAKIFKTDLQAKADSIFFSYSDSTIRCYINPMLWTQGSQLSGDTIDLQMKNKKLDNMDIYYNSFAVNVEKDDSVHFNQVGGKKMRGFFKSGKLDVLFVDGNSETIYYNRDSTTKRIKGIERSLSTRLRLKMKNGGVSVLAFLNKPETRYAPPHLFKEDDRMLKNFIWKPKERPLSKETIINSYKRKAANRAAARAAAASKLPPPGKTALKQVGGSKMSGDSSLRNKPALRDSTKTDPADKEEVITIDPEKANVNRNRVADGTLNTAPVILPAVVQPKDTSNVKQPGANPPVKKDTTGKQK